MPISEQSYETKINRFDNGLTLINGWADYDPTNPNIKKPALIALVPSIRTANTLVDTTKTILGNKQSERLLKTFTQYETVANGSRGIVNLDCLEERILAIHSYVKGEDFAPATRKALEKIIKHIRPVYPKKKEGERGRPSPSERSFAAAAGYGDTVVTLITALGADYNPIDANLSVANMTALVADIRQLNKDVQTALKNYGDANRARRILYSSQGGLSERTTQIKNYLASGPGRKKNDKYIEFNDAIKGR